MSTTTVHISVDLSQRHAHLFTVTMMLDNAAPDQMLSMPVWTPGSYMVREFAQHVVSISAQEQGRPIAIEKTNKNTFMAKNSHQQLVITYQVYGFDSSIRAAYIDDRQAFFNGTALFLRPHGMDEARYLVSITAPQGWSEAEVASNLNKLDTDVHGFGTYEADSYESLVDHPVQISSMRRLRFMAADIPHEIVLVGDVRAFDEERLVKDLASLCTSHIDLFEGYAPFSSYLFIARFEEGGYGGLEHQSSTMLLASPYCLPKKGLQDADTNYRNFLSLCSHEYYHAWNVKKLRPHNLIRYNFDTECYTTMLWLFEGITSYYDDLQVRRSGLMSVSAYLDIMGKNYTKLLKNKGRTVQCLADASFDAWIKFYRPHENSQNTSVSYYLKGSFVALYLDLMIRHRSNNAVSLDTIMKRALSTYGVSGVSEANFFALMAETGIDADTFKKDYIYGTRELDLGPVLDKFGITLSLGKDELSLDDKTKMSAFLGIKVKFNDNGAAIISSVEQDGPGMRAGLCPYDEIIALNNTRLDSDNASDLFASVAAGEAVRLTYARKRSMRDAVLNALELPVRVCKLSLKSAINSQEREALASWLSCYVD